MDIYICNSAIFYIIICVYHFLEVVDRCPETSAMCRHVVAHHCSQILKGPASDGARKTVPWNHCPKSCKVNHEQTKRTRITKTALKLKHANRRPQKKGDSGVYHVLEKSFFFFLPAFSVFRRIHVLLPEFRRLK